MFRRLLLALALCSLHAPANALDLFGGKTVGKMGGVDITATQLRELIDAQTPEVRKALMANPATLRELVQAELLRRLLVAEAKKAEWDKRPDVALTAERAREQSVIDGFVAERARPDAAYPAEKDIAAAYEANKPQFRVAPQVRLAQILLRVAEGAGKDEADRIAVQAREIFIKLGKGGKFADFVVFHSQDEASKEKGGDLGWLSLDALLPPIRAEVQTLKPGEHTRPVRTQFGWQIVKLIEAKPESVRPLAEVRDAIAKALRDARAQENRNRYIEELRQQSPITIDDKVLGEVGRK